MTAFLMSIFSGMLNLTGQTCLDVWQLMEPSPALEHLDVKGKPHGAITACETQHKAGSHAAVSLWARPLDNLPSWLGKMPGPTKECNMTSISETSVTQQSVLQEYHLHHHPLR